jgi:nucleotide-binding universal stress UspA family protein
MRTVFVATDFSVRSDRAIRRAVLLAQKAGAALWLVHAVDDDQPGGIVEAERAAAWTLLDDQARSIVEVEGLECTPLLVLGDPFEAVTAAAEEHAADLLVIGPHRRRVLRDVFTGTTAERAIRESRRPVLMANSVPAGGYRHALIALDLTAGSGDAIRAVTALGLDRDAAISVIHVYDAPGSGLMARASLSADQVEEYLAGEEARIGRDVDALLGTLRLDPVARILKRNPGSVAHAIQETAREVAADLVVVGTRGHAGVTRFLLGSVAAEVLRSADRDVLAVPAGAEAA